MLEPPLPEQRRKEIFLALVEAQDGGASVKESWKVIAERFALSEQQVRQVEREGLDAGWPPLEGTDESPGAEHFS
jgi:hypothetical protein